MRLDNPFVAANAVSAALSTPANNAAKLIPHLVESAEPRDLLHASSDASELCVHLITEGEIEASLILADALFALPAKAEATYPDRHEAYWYMDGLKRVVSVLTDKAGRWLCERLCKWLSVGDSIEPASVGSFRDEYSYVWRERIEREGDEANRGLRDSLVAITRDTFEAVIRLDQELSVDDATRLLKEQNRKSVCDWEFTWYGNSPRNGRTPPRR